MVSVATAILIMAAPAPAQIQRVLGLDISAWQSSISQTTWNNICTNENRQFVILRSSRGGTTGYYDQNDSGNNNGLNTFSQRYDDPYYVQNISRSTTAGMFAGSYHFSRPDVIATTQNSGGIPNTGTDEADHFIQMAGPWMRPGYLVPVHDFEAGDGARPDNDMAQFCIDFSNRIFERMGIRPAIYINGNYAENILGGATQTLRDQLAKPALSQPSLILPASSVLWSARWPNQTNPASIDVQNSEPKDSISYIYGPWDDYGDTHPWVYWQYTSRGRLASFNNGGSNLDMNVARGGVEFLKDYLVPAIWINNSNGDWSTLTNWNSGQTPIAPVQGPGQVARVGSLIMPVPRLPGAAGSGTTSGQHDTVILERTNVSISVTLSSGTHNIRKLYMRETLNIIGGALTVNYIPSADSTTNGAEFSGPVILSGTGSLSVHTLQVDTNQTFTVGGGTLIFNTINLMPHSSLPAKILMSGNVNINPLSNVTATITKGTDSGSTGLIDLGGNNRTFTVGNDTADVDLSIAVPIISANGALSKSGTGTMNLAISNSYGGGTTISAGRLLVNNTNGSGTGNGPVVVNGGTLAGNGIIAGAVTVNSAGTIAPGMTTGLGKLTLNSKPTFNGTTFIRVDRNSGSSLADKIVLSSGTLTYGGTLVVSNVGSIFMGGEVFTNFSASAYSGAFATTNLPALNSGLNWYLGMLPTNGTLKVNRAPVANPSILTNFAPLVLQIPINSLLTNDTDADGDLLKLTSISLLTTNGIILTTNSTHIFYSNYVSVVDRFTYTISDERGGSSTGVVQIASSPTARFSGWPIRNDNSVTLHVIGSPGRTYYLDRSTNLPIWMTVSTNVAPGSGLFDFIDDFQGSSTPPAEAFYRLKWLP